MFWRLVARSVYSNKSRSLFLVLSLALSSFLLVIAASFAASLDSNIERGVRGGLSGDLMVVDAVNPRLQLTGEVPVGFVPIRNAGVAMRIVLEDPDVASVAPRTMASGVVLAGASTAPAMLIGFDPNAEPTVVRQLPAGSREALANPRTILLGRGMAARLHRLGTAGAMTVLIPTLDGLFAGDAMDVAGVYNWPGLPLVDEFIAFLPLGHLQALLGEESQPRSLVVRLHDGVDVSEVRRRLREALRREKLDLEVWTWEDTAGDLLGIVSVGRFVIGSGFLGVLLVVALGVHNMHLILMLKKTREIGLMRALGTERVRIVVGLLAEAGLVSILASAAGALLGGSVCTALGHVGIPAASQAMTYVFGAERFYPEVHVRELLLGFLVVGLVGPIAALQPALRASAAAPMDALTGPE